ncbi:MAG TPA: hypothetical protein VKW09_14570 [bacterium]|nr:hypothetical protein [bacterium]
MIARNTGRPTPPPWLPPLPSPRALLTAALLLACVAGTQALVDIARPPVNDEAAVRFSGAAMIVRGFAGQIRGLLADFLWLRVDEYAHRRRLINGDINRSDDEAILPLVRLITWLDPHYVNAYALGGQWLAFHFGKPREAVAFYDEGIRNNPRAADLLTGAAFIHWKLLHDNAAAAARVEQAAEITDDPIEKFHALWLEAHILLERGDRAGAARIWHKVAEIPGYGPTAQHFLNLMAHPRATPDPHGGGSPGAGGLEPFIPAGPGGP